MVIFDVETIYPSAEQVPAVIEAEEVESVELEETDSTDNYSVEDGDGIQVREFMRMLEEVVHKHSDGLFAFSDPDNLNEEAFEEIEDVKLRNALIEFTNKTYNYWKNHWIDIPNYNSVRDGCRGHCDGCESDGAWTTPEYEGVLPNDCDSHPDYVQISNTFTSLQRERARERNGNLQARLQTEYEEWRENHPDEFTCDEDCDSFLDRVGEEMRDTTCVQMGPLKRAFETFCQERGLSISVRLPEPSGPEPVIVTRLRPMYRDDESLVSIRTMLRHARNWTN